jgi:DNA-binding NarL/FixJ family response regulator
MSRATPRTSLQVCCVTQNRLAETYLKQLLRADRRILPLNLREYSQLAPSCRGNVIFVTDKCGLEIPLRECLRQLRDLSSDSKFLVLDDQKSKEEILEFLIMGAHGYVSHTDAPRVLVRAVLCIANNQAWIPPDLLPDVLHEVGCALRKKNQTRKPTTPREEEVLELVSRRLSNREIADLLQIRVSTVKFHLSNILSKFHVSNRRELTGSGSQNQWRMLLQRPVVICAKR